MLMHIVSPTFSFHINFFGFGGQSRARTSSSLSALTCDVLLYACTVSCMSPDIDVWLRYSFRSIQFPSCFTLQLFVTAVFCDPGRSLPFRTSQSVVAVVSSVDVAFAGLDCSICRRIRVARRRCVLRGLFYQSSL